MVRKNTIACSLAALKRSLKNLWKDGEYIVPYKSKKPCSFPGCKELTFETYCALHKTEMNSRYDKERGNASSRGYDSTWIKLKNNYIASHPLCAECLKEDKVVPAVLVHHVVPIREGGERLSEDNLVALCNSCHERIHKWDRFRRNISHCY